MPSPHSAPVTRLPTIRTSPSPRSASTMIAAQPFFSPSEIGMPAPGAVVGTLNGGMWKPSAQDVLWPPIELRITRTPVTFCP